jgi:hypothetical protein
MTTTALSVDTIEYINDDSVMIVVGDEQSAKQYLRRNPRAQVIRGQSDDERIALVYKAMDTNLLNAVKRG